MQSRHHVTAGTKGKSMLSPQCGVHQDCIDIFFVFSHNASRISPAQAFMLCTLAGDHSEAMHLGIAASVNEMTQLM